MKNSEFPAQAVDITRELFLVPRKNCANVPQIYDSKIISSFDEDWYIFNGSFFCDEHSETIYAEHTNEIDRFLGHDTESWAILKYQIPLDVSIHVDAKMTECADPKVCQPNLIVMLIGSIVLDFFPNYLGVVRWFPNLSWTPLDCFEGYGHSFQELQVNVTRSANNLCLSINHRESLSVNLENQDTGSIFRDFFAIGNRCSKVHFSNIAVRAK